jgi:DNA-binding IclR family transcriptional regulator
VCYKMKQNLSDFTTAEKVIETLLSFQIDRPQWGTRELGAHLGFSPSTAQRILNTLKDYHFVQQDPITRKYHLGSIFYEFINTLQVSNPLTRTAQPYMSRLLALTKETIALNVIANGERTCIDVIESPRSVKVTLAIGTKNPLYVGSSGKCMLAFSSDDFINTYFKQTTPVPITINTITDKNKLRNELQIIKKQGYATGFGEKISGFGSMSAPILNHKGSLLGCINIVVPEIRLDDKEHKEFCLENLLNITKELSRNFGYQP